MTLDDLKQLPQWVGYTKDKIPINPHTGRAASSNDPASWGTAAQAWARRCRDGLPGIGFVFTKEAGVVGVDMDDCLRDDGGLKDYARDVVQCLDSYTERSPSGHGIHVLVRGEIPHSLKTERVEIYDELRYFTVTGNVYGRAAVDEGLVAADIMERRKELLAIWVAFGGDLDIERTKLPDVARAEKREVTEAEIRDMLAVLPSWGDYNSHWLPVLMAVHSEFPDERGVALIEGWSPGKRGEVRRKFKSFDNTPRGGITIGTLIHMAKEHGYQPRRAGKQPRLSHRDKLAALAGA